MDPTAPNPPSTARTPTSAELAAVLHALGHDDGAVEDLWLDFDGGRVHLDVHRAAAPRAVVVFHPGSGSYARFYCGLGQRLAASGFHMLGIDRPGHGWSDGPRGDGSIDEALALTAQVVAYARAQFGLPVVLMGSSLGGLLCGFAVLAGQRPDLAVAHNFLIPGRLVSMRLRARAVARWRRRPYPLHKLVHGLARLSRVPALQAYLAAGRDPQAAWTLSPRLVASLFGHNPPRPAGPTAPLIVLSGSRDPAIPAWASRWFLRWSGARDTRFVEVPGAGHLLFHDDLERSWERLVPLLNEGLGLHAAPN
ncbi:MAG: alpha/beta fold hydrolase [Rubrivivax sp.]|nr:alpha/beta fold hydrolase [Rubrivivax sp.]